MTFSCFSPDQIVWTTVLVRKCLTTAISIVGNRKVKLSKTMTAAVGLLDDLLLKQGMEMILRQCLYPNIIDCNGRAYIIHVCKTFFVCELFDYRIFFRKFSMKQDR